MKACKDTDYKCKAIEKISDIIENMAWRKYKNATSGLIPHKILFSSEEIQAIIESGGKLCQNIPMKT